jgi:hypothetical protein
MRYFPRLLAPLSLGALALALASCGDQPTQPNVPANPPIAAATAPASDTWIERARDPAGNPDPNAYRSGVVAADVPNAAGQSVLYVIGGHQRGEIGGGLRAVEAYNVATDTWTRKRDLPMGLAYANGAGVIRGKIYVAGGRKEGSMWITYAVFVYDPARDTWTRLAGMPARGTYGVAGVIGGKLYVSVPYADNSDRSHLFRYDPATNKWATLPSPRHLYHMGGVLYDKLYLVGNQTEMYDPATNRWTEKAPPPSAYIDIWGGAAPAQAKLYVFSGIRTLVYAPLSDSWSVRPNFAPELAIGGPVAARVFLNGKPRIEVLGEGMHYQYVP